MGAVIYARVSTDEQAQKGISLDDQIARCVEYCESKEFAVTETETVVDIGSGKDTARRPGINRVLEMVRRRKVKDLVVWRLDRLSRNTVESIKMKEFMDKKRVELHVVNENGPVQARSADDEFLFTLKVGLAQRERKVISERTRAALARKKERGERVSRYAPFGCKFRRGKIIPDERELGIKARIQELYGAGTSIRAIERCLASEGVVNRSGNPLGRKTIAKVCRELAA